MRIQVGDPSIDWFALQPQSDRKHVVVVEDGRPRMAGTSTEEISLVDDEGQPALRRTQTLASAELGSRRTETVVFRDGFFPCRHLDVTPAWTVAVAYRGTKILGEKRLTRGEAMPIETEVEAPIFDYHSVEMVLRVLPLREGLDAELRVFHAVRGVCMTVTIEVLGLETVTISDQATAAWHVQTDWNGHVRQSYWISEKTRELLKQLSSPTEHLQLQLIRGYSQI